MVSLALVMITARCMWRIHGGRRRIDRRRCSGRRGNLGIRGSDRFWMIVMAVCMTANWGMEIAFCASRGVVVVQEA